MRRLDRRGRIIFENVAEEGAAEACPISQDELLARFHVRLPNGDYVSGARAFTEAYAQIPGLGFAAWFGRNRWTRGLLNWLYGHFLRVRPRLQRIMSN